MPNRTIRRRDDDDSASSVSLFSCLSLCLCAWLSIAGNKVPPALDDIGSMGGTNSIPKNSGRPPSPGLSPVGGEGMKLKGGLEYPYAAPRY